MKKAMVLAIALGLAAPLAIGGCEPPGRDRDEERMESAPGGGAQHEQDGRGTTSRSNPPGSESPMGGTGGPRGGYR